MNWGTKITIVFSVFVAGIVFMVFNASKQNMDLVVPDYYEKELQYQQVIDAQTRTSLLSGKVECRVENDTLSIQLPSDMVGKKTEINVWLYCISDKKRDIQKDYVTHDGKVLMPLTILNKGAHDVKLSWATEGQEYSFEQKLFIQ